MSTMFNNLFPGLDLQRVKHSNLKRVVLINFDAERDIIEWRHYFIKQNYTDMNNKIKKMVNNKKLPNLGDCKDLSQYFTGNVGYVSESDVDNLPNSKVQVEESSKNGKVNKKKVNLRLFEIGPRMTMKLVKIEEGFLGGDVFYHRYKKKSHGEKRKAATLIEAKEKARQERREAQEANVSEKMKKMEEKLARRSKRKDVLGKREELGEGEEVPEGAEGEGEEGEEVTQPKEGGVDDSESEESVEAHHGGLDDVDYEDDDQEEYGDVEHLEGDEDMDDVDEDEIGSESDYGDEMNEEDIDRLETNFV